LRPSGNVDWHPQREPDSASMMEGKSTDRGSA
jgi:hypothetical protein